MSDVYISSCNILSPLGITSADNFSQLKNGISGIKQHTNSCISDKPFYASIFNDKNTFNWNEGGNYTIFEQLILASVSEAMVRSGIDIGDIKTGMIISSTKGNIGLLESDTYLPNLRNRIALHTSAKLVSDYFNMVNPPVIISNACISGLLGIIVGMRMIQDGFYDNMVITAADVMTKFVLSGFQSLNAISTGRCKPFDAERSGITLGEGAATIIITSNKKNTMGIKVLAGSANNDANHISAPSRTGEELAHAINVTLHDAYLSKDDIDFISAHGTGTIYNDEMEAKAFNLTHLQTTPVNSFKGYYGHTLGAAGLIESVVSIHSLQENLILPNMGFKQLGVTVPLNICTTLLQSPVKNILKTASGFGGCNAAVAFGKL